MNPLQQTEREVDVSGASRWISRISILIVIGAVVLSWVLVRPAGENGLWIMSLWFLTIVVAVAALLLVAVSKGLNSLILTVVAALAAVLGTVIAFLSGDKFDALRAALVSVILIVASYPHGVRQKAAVLRGNNE